MSICYLLDGEMPPARQNGKSLPCVRLQAENDSLRKELAVTNPLFETLNAANDRLIYENAKLRELLQRLLAEYRYLRVRPRKMYLQHEGRMRAIEEEMRELGIEVDE